MFAELDEKKRPALSIMDKKPVLFIVSGLALKPVIQT
jgi:hypothetical protein